MEKILKLFRVPRSYVVWNEEKVGEHTPLNASSLIGLIDAEERINSSISSRIVTTDIREAINSIHNETNIELRYAPYALYLRTQVTTGEYNAKNH